MSTQSARSIRLTHSSPQQAFRLLELTPEILELISSPNAPTLYLKSPGTDDPSITTTGPENNAYVNLCTPTKTFRIRQVQSSNSVHVIKPSDGQNEVIPLLKRHGDTNKAMNTPETVTAIAKCGSTLELHGLADDESFASAKNMLARMLTVWGGETSFNNDDEGDVDMDDSELSTKRMMTVKKSVIDDLPFADTQCRKAWIEICAFVPDNYNGEDRPVFRPSATVRLDIWKRILEGCILQNIDMEKQFLVHDVWKAILRDVDDESEERIPRSLFDAIVRRLAEQSGDLGDENDSRLKWSNIDKEVCIKWIGETYLEATAPTEKRAIGRSEFLNAWKDLLPETWRDETLLSNLPEASYKHPDPVSIHFVAEPERENVKKEGQDSAGSGAKAKNSRNWHERFKSQRK
ncbi:sister chromatid cohesion protein Dcc1, putative [Talaromyces stipitatus ATCC 10500]|uniref:Sister chromatid cohesion protein Dcc1, putative n=1 Tax=Talaromyces stipitatus (strain ATCC 10500 / CBS 375.48 / QM 6759 / NRRL 1006) TaxID=441959 RepID=B8MBN8_TALSN|nr:sister chromatid cohesion protein Dcc1, putative [Talaromyces stipitatus ATCC 10500]EED18171.1 sister chromatid cohesion protein Dcc1, putative [Talaromyces stipitatus ATCC 10500]